MQPNQTPIPPAAPAARKPVRKGTIAAMIFAISAMLLLCVVVAVVPTNGQDGSKITTGSDSNAATGRALGEAAGSAVESITSEPAPVALTAADFELSVKIIGKQCFGSAGCNVEYRIEAAGSGTALNEDDGYTLTYEVSGFEDGQTQINTLRVPGGQTVQDGYQFGQTARSSSKLKVKIIDVERDF